MNKQEEKEIQKEETKVIDTKLPKCGIVMPISSIDNCSAEHWAEVLNIMKDSINQAGFEPNLVSDADDSGIIQKRIIQNLYSNEIVICDVSAKNPNVMFELGMRLAFDKPTIIIKDDKTDYSFDTSVIEHLSYPRDLRFNKILIFKEALKKKVQATYEKSIKDKNYTTFLKHFGEYKIAQLSEKEISSEKYILSILDELRHEMTLIRRNQQASIEANNTVTPYRKKRQIVSKYIAQFMKERGINLKEEIYLMDREDELFEYLAQFNDVRMACEESGMLRDIMISLIRPDK